MTREDFVPTHEVSGSAHSSTRVGLGRVGLGRVGKDARFATQTGAAAPIRPKKQWRAEKRALLVEIATACKRHNQPHIPEGAKDILLGAIGDLLNTGYDLALIRTTSLNAALDYDGIRGYSKLLQLRMRVRAAQTQVNLEDHERRKREERVELAARQAVATPGHVRAAKAALLSPRPHKYQCPRCGQVFFYPGTPTSCADGSAHRAAS
jgi:hypothetical protein